jgi:predicted DNA-binding transcriptional regulator AlpA
MSAGKPLADEAELITASQAARMVGIGKRTWWRFVSSGRAPAPRRICGCVRWWREEIRQWIANGCPAVRKEVTR